MNTSLLILAAAALGLVVNTLAVLGVAVKAGKLLGRMETSLDRFGVDVQKLTSEVEVLGRTSRETAMTTARTVAQLDGLEYRVMRLERVHDGNHGSGV